MFSYSPVLQIIGTVYLIFVFGIVLGKTHFIKLKDLRSVWQMVKMIGFPSLLFFNIAKMSFNLDNLKLFLVVFVVQFSVHILIFIVSIISKKSDMFSNYIYYTFIFGFN